ncbi:MAG TPA: chromate transporter [Vicinamibacterales bacterium]|jgi:chromate transporter|nr:chromate transporter [Vicinamibacterales bacterium]
MNAPLRQLTWIFTRDVTFTFGGGNASMELLRRSLQSRGWIDAPTHALLMAVSRLTPGTSILAYCASGGWLLNGWRGTLAAVAGGSLPGSLIIFGLAATLGTLDRYALVRALLSVGMLAAAWLVLASAWVLLKPYVTTARRRRALVIVAIAATLYLIGWTPVRVLLVSAIAGALLPATKRGTLEHPPSPTATMPV